MMDREVLRDVRDQMRAFAGIDQMTPPRTSKLQHAPAGPSIAGVCGETRRHSATLARRHSAAVAPGRSESAAFSKPRRPLP